MDDNTFASSSKSSTSSTISDKTFNGLGDLIKLLPTGTVFLFQFLNPLLTNGGNCNTFDRYLSGALLVICGFSCCFSTFTDSYTGTDGKLYYGVVTKKGIWAPFDKNAASENLSKYRLRFGDFVHASLSLLVFAVVSLLDGNTVDCFYPSFKTQEKMLVKVMPVVVGGLASFLFMVFPNYRHGIGYPAGQSTEDSK